MFILAFPGNVGLKSSVNAIHFIPEFPGNAKTNCEKQVIGVGNANIKYEKNNTENGNVKNERHP